MHRAASTYQPRNARATTAGLFAALAALVAGCVTDPTQISVIVDTDLRGRRGLTISAIVRRGAVDIAGDAEPDFVRPGDGGTADGGLPSPASFTVIPLRGGPEDDLVTIQVEARAGAVAVRQTQRARFIPHHTVVVRMFLTALCAMEDRVCAGEACSRQVFCEAMGQTCGPQGQCVAIATGLDGGVLTDASDIHVTDAPRCTVDSCDTGETACTCPGVCPPRSGDRCCAAGSTHCTDTDCPVMNGDGCCSPGHNNCNDSDCAVMNGDGCCSANHNNCNDSDCPVANGDGCCSSGRNNCNDSDCPVANGDGCCSPGHNNCSDADCAVMNGDGCCSPGHNNCNDSDCPVVNQDGCCTAGPENHCSEAACPPCNNNGVCETPCGEYQDSCPGDCTCEARCCDNRIEGRYRATYQDCYDSRTFVCGSTGALRVRWMGTEIWTRTAACP